jgi:hypothetical protein
VAAFQFFYLAVVIDKGELCNPHLKQKESFYNYTVRLVFENAKPFLSNTIVVLDRSGGWGFANTSRHTSRGRYVKETASRF